MTDKIDPPLEQTLFEELSKDPQFQEGKQSGKAVVIVGAEKQSSARERALKILSTNPKWKEIPPDDCIVGIGGGKPVSRT